MPEIENEIEKLDHGEVSAVLLKWFIANNPGDFIFQNSSGYASNEHVRYGLPNTGGGFDYLCFKDNAVTEFIEVKTDGYPYLSKNQKIFARNMSSKGFKCWVFRCHLDRFYLVPALDYKAVKLPEALEVVANE